jgi:hypothetical protein
MADSSYFEMSSSSSSVPADCCFGLELTRDISRYEVTGRPQAWRMRVRVTKYNNVDPNIFMFLRRGPDQSTGDFHDTFEAVASPVDLEERPAGEPRPDEDPPFFRLSDIDLLARSMELLEETWQSILQDRDELIRTLTTLCELDPAESNAYGCFPEESVEPVSPEPSPTPEPESSEAPTCPVDPVTHLEIIDSDDPDFPIGSIFLELGSITPDCQRAWETTGIISGKVLALQTSLAIHTYVANFDGATAGAGDLADAYHGFIHYTKVAGEDHTLRIAGVS